MRTMIELSNANLPKQRTTDDERCQSKFGFYIQKILTQYRPHPHMKIHTGPKAVNLCKTKNMPNSSLPWCLFLFALIQLKTYLTLHADGELLWGYCTKTQTNQICKEC